MSKPSPTRHPVIALVDEVVRLRGRMRSIFAEASAAMGLSNVDSTVLTAVAEAPFLPTVPQIGRSLGHPRQVVQRSANALAQAGLIAFVPNPDHKRAALLQVTDAGDTLYHKLSAQAESIAEGLRGIIDFDTCRSTANELKRLRDSLETYLRNKSD